MTKGDYLIAIGLVSVILFLGLNVVQAYSQNVNTSSYQIYENKTANVRIQYPANWFSETMNLQDFEIVRIFPMDFMAERVVPVGFTIGVHQMNTYNITEAYDFILSAIQSLPNSRVINSTTNATLFNGTTPAYIIEAYDFTRPFMDTKDMIIGTVLNNTDGFILRYYAEPRYFDKYLPEARKMIDSFQVISNKSTTLDQLLTIGESLYVEGKYTEAIDYYNKVLALAPNNTGALYDKGLALDVLGLHGDAIPFYDKVLSVEPDNINALINKGSALADLGRYSEAIEYFDKVLVLDPSNVLAAENKELAESLTGHLLLE